MFLHDSDKSAKHCDQRLCYCIAGTCRVSYVQSVANRVLTKDPTFTCLELTEEHTPKEHKKPS